ncbi:MAG: universal stress protein [Polyangiaceae bacterium]
MPREPAVRATAERARLWCEAILARSLDPRSLAFARGPVGAAVLDAIDETAADLVVLGEGGLARYVARTTRRPLLVARAPRETARILAFTDFSDPRFPVLRQAAALRREAGEVTFVGSRHRGTPAAQRARLMAGVAAEYANVKVLVSDQRPTEQALLATAHLWGADLVAVPSHPQALLMRAGLGDLGCRVAASATSSVLVVPVGPAAASA